MPRAYEQYLRDILAATRSIADNISGLSYEDFAGDLNHLKAILYDLIVIGEACNHLPERVRERSPEIPWGQIIGLRNVIVHGYWQVKPPVIWRTVSRDVPELGAAVAHLLDTLGEEDDD